MMTFDQQFRVLKDVAYLDWRIELHMAGDGHRYLQVEFEDDDNYNPGVPYLSKGRKWLVSPHMTKSELVLTAWKAVLTAIEHEAREKFTYKEKMIFGPHIDVDALLSVAHVEEVRA